MTRQKTAPPWGQDLARAVTYERHERQHPVGTTANMRSARPPAERPPVAGRMRPTGGAVPIRPTVLRTHRLVLTGHLDADTATDLEAEVDMLCESGIDELILDLGGLGGIDAIGVKVLAVRAELCRRRGVRVTIERLDGPVREALAAAGLRGLRGRREAEDEKALRKGRKIVGKG